MYQIGAAAAIPGTPVRPAYLALAGRAERRIILLCVSPDNVERAQWQWRQWVSYNPKLTTIVDLMNRCGCGLSRGE